MTHRAGILRVATLALLWGSAFLWIKISLRGFTPPQILVTRLTLGAAALTLALVLRHERLPRGRRAWWHLTVAAVFGNVVPYLLFAVAERQVASSVAGILNATTPLWTVIVAVAARQGRRPNGVQLGGLALGLVGAVLIFTPWNAGSQFMSRGALACLLAAASYAVSYVYIGRFLAHPAASPLALSAGQLLVASALSLLTLPLFDGLATPRWRPDALVSTAILGILGTGLAYVINYRIITDDGAIAASVTIYLLPVVAIALGVAWLDETLTVHAIAGTLVVLLGVAAVRHISAPPPFGERTDDG